MNRVHFIVTACLGIAVGAGTVLTCNATVNKTVAFQDGTRTEKPRVVLSHERWNLDASFPEPGSPTLSKWRNGSLVVSCPSGYHFDVWPRNESPLNNDRTGPNATCEPNP
ncbi:MAG: hypothetical protein JWO84_71 [Parcubacteria group bacterium]|nr:hypothetical protein [Parcubacteria group bacterium]